MQLKQSRAECLPTELRTHFKKVPVAFEDKHRPGRFSCCDSITNGIASENNRERGQGEIHVEVKGQRLEAKAPPDRAESFLGVQLKKLLGFIFDFFTLVSCW